MAVLLFLALAVAELYTALWVAARIGALNTIGLMILVSMVGASLVKRAGLGALARLRDTVAEGAMPHREVVDGLLLLLAGSLLFVPGFITDVVAVLLLVPPVRSLVRGRIIKRYQQRGRVIVQVIDGVGHRFDASGRVRDVTARETTRDDGDRPTSPPQLEP